MRIYQLGIVNFNDDFGQFLLESIYNKEKELAKIDEGLSSRFLISHMDRFRKSNDIPNKILAIVKKNDEKWCLVAFDHEPVDESFKVNVDENNSLYVELNE